MKKSLFFAFSLTLMVSLMSLGGCANKVTGDDVRANPSPMLKSIAHTDQQLKNRGAYSRDTTMRQFWDDVDAFFLQDRPLRLSKYPIP